MDRLEQLQDRATNKSSESILVTEKLYSSPFVDKRFKDRNLIIFGNTGFSLDLDTKSGDCSFGFEPEGRTKPLEKESAKYATMFAAGLLEFHKLLNDREASARLKADFSGVKYFGASTNFNMVNAIENVFSRSNNKSLLKISNSLIDIDVQGFKDLPGGDPLIVFLGDVVKRGENTIVNYHKYPEHP